MCYLHAPLPNRIVGQERLGIYFWKDFSNLKKKTVKGSIPEYSSTGKTVTNRANKIGERTWLFFKLNV